MAADDYYDDATALAEFHESRGGVRRLVESGVTAVPRLFLVPDTTQPPRGVTDFAIPTVDLSLPRSDTVALIGAAARSYGFFHVTNHGVPAASPPLSTPPSLQPGPSTSYLSTSAPPSTPSRPSLPWPTPPTRTRRTWSTLLPSRGATPSVSASSRRSPTSAASRRRAVKPFTGTIARWRGSGRQWLSCCRTRWASERSGLSKQCRCKRGWWGVTTTRRARSRRRSLAAAGTPTQVCSRCWCRTALAGYRCGGAVMMLAAMQGGST